MKIFFISIIFLLFYFNYSFATAPKQINLSYDKQKELLIIDIDHISHNVRKHYIRKIEIYKNNELIKEFFPPAQKPTGLSISTPLIAKEKDEIMVKAICKEAGSARQMLIIPSVENTHLQPAVNGN